MPGTFAAEDELIGIADGVVAAGGGLFEVAPQGLEFEDDRCSFSEVDWMRRLALRTGLPVTFAMLPDRAEPDLWRERSTWSPRPIAAAANCARRSPPARSG